MLLYIDPGTGSMLFAILIGIIGAVHYVLRIAIVKIRFILSGGKKGDIDLTKRIPYVIFSDNKRYWTQFEPICREFNKRGIDLVYMTASPDDPVFDCGYEHIEGRFIGEGNKAFATLNFLNADIVLSTTPGLDVYQWKRSAGVKCYVHIYHQPGEVMLYRMFGVDYYDALLLGGEDQIADIRKLEELRNLPAKEVCTVGIPYMDEMVSRLKNDEEKQAGSGREKAVEKAKEAAEDVTVLLAPSWGESAIFSKFGGRIIEELLKTGYRIIVRPHPQSFTSEKELMDELMEKYPASDRLEWNRDVDNYEVLRRSDILISDFSGVTFDFAFVYDKPVIYTDTEFDTAPYDAWWIKDITWTEKTLKSIGMMLTEDKIDSSSLKTMIDECLSSDIYANARKQAREERWEHPGEGAVRAVDYLIKKHEELLADE